MGLRLAVAVAVVVAAPIAVAVAAPTAVAVVARGCGSAALAYQVSLLAGYCFSIMYFCIQYSYPYQDLL